MSQKGIEQLIGKALTDEKFREDFLKNPQDVVRNTQLDISSEELAQIKKIDAAKIKQFTNSFAKEFGDRKQGLFG